MFPFKFEIIDAMKSYAVEYFEKYQGISPEEFEKLRKQLLENYSSRLLALYTMYIVYSDKQSIVNHLRLHKMHHYNFKFEEGKKELMDNIPQILTVWTQFDDITQYFSKTFLGNSNTHFKEIEQKFFKFILDYIQKKHPEHFVRKFFIKFKKDFKKIRIFYSIFYLF